MFHVNGLYGFEVEGGDGLCLVLPIPNLIPISFAQLPP